MTEALAVVTACDQAFLAGLLALLRSLERHDPDRIVYLLDCGISDGDRADLGRRFPNLRIVIVEPPSGLPKPSVGSQATYARLLVGDLFRKRERVLYLDADTIVVSDLRELEVLTLRPPYIAAACVEPYTPSFCSNNGVVDFRRLGFIGNEPYFNAGVLLIDINGWNSAGVKDKVLSYLMRTDIRITLFDQEALNVVLAGCWQRLDPEWNVSRYWVHESRRTARPNILRDAHIVHFLSDEKPWSSPETIHPWLLDRYEEFAARD